MKIDERSHSDESLVISVERLDCSFLRYTNKFLLAVTFFKGLVTSEDDLYTEKESKLSTENVLSESIYIKR